MIVNYIIAYLIGSIPFGLILTKLSGYGDIRSIGSGNIGATNVLRTGNKTLAFATLLMDGAKGALAIMLCFFLQSYIYPLQETALFPASDALLIGVFAIIGHIFPIWLKFNGGKGVATALGTLLMAAPYTGIIACFVWLGTAFLFRFSSLAAIVALAAAPLATLYFNGMMVAAINFAISILVIYRHKENIKRLLNGTEPKIGKKKNEPA